MHATLIWQQQANDKTQSHTKTMAIKILRLTFDEQMQFLVTDAVSIFPK